MRCFNRSAWLRRAGSSAAVASLCVGSLITTAFILPVRVNAAGFTAAVAADPDDKPMQIGIWYPDTVSGSSTARLPLVVLSHGIAGTYMDLKPIATALADSGFVAVGVMHTGDNFNDKSYLSRGQHLHGRSCHIARTIDYMLSEWLQHETIDAARIGIYGFSVGGFAALVAVSGEPELSR